MLRNIYDIGILAFLLGHWTCISAVFLQLMSHFTEQPGEGKEVVIPT